MSYPSARNSRFFIIGYLLVSILLLALLFLRKNKNNDVKNHKQNIELHLRPHEKLIGATRENVKVWLLTEDTLTHIKYLRESYYGTINGEIIIK